MSNNPVFVRAMPRKIEINEIFNYKSDISANPLTEPLEKPTGEIIVEIPYDGEKHFTRKALGDVERQLGVKGNNKDVLGRIGFINITKHTRTDFDQDFNLTGQYNNLPVEIPVRTNELRELDDLTNDKHTCMVSYPYTPNWMETLPLKFNVSILDEELIRQFIEMEEEGDENEVSLNERIAREIASQVSFSQSLLMSLDISLALPSWVGKANDPAPPILELMAIKWPVTTSYRAVHLFVEDEEGFEEGSIEFNPQSGQIEWGKMKFIPPEAKDAGTDLLVYRAPTLLIHIDQPGEFYQRKNVEGSLKISIPRLISGIRVNWFDVRGEMDKTLTVSPKSEINTQLNFYVEDLFERRIFSPYQHLQFTGVILEEMRVTDIITLLEDRGFRSEKIELESEQPDKKRFFITATKPEGPGTMSLWLLVEGTRAKTTRETRIPGGKTFTTNIETGNMVIYMRGEVEKDNTRLVNTMNDIQTLLKNRFKHVSTVE